MKKGFTLLEVMIVLSVLAALYLIVMPAYRSIQDEGNDTVARKETETLELALASYYKNNGSLPFNKTGSGAALSGFGLSVLTTTVPRLIDQLPGNPFFIDETYASGQGAYYYHITYTGKVVPDVTYLSPSNSMYHILSRGRDRRLDGVSYGSNMVYAYGDEIVVTNAPLSRLPGQRPAGFVLPY